MNDSQTFSRRASGQGDKIETEGKRTEPTGCPGIDHGPGSTLHSRIRAISPNLLKVLRKK